MNTDLKAIKHMAADYKAALQSHINAYHKGMVVRFNSGHTYNKNHVYRQYQCSACNTWFHDKREDV